MTADKLLRWGKTPPLWLLLLRLAAASALLWAGMELSAGPGRIVLHALGWVLASGDAAWRLRDGFRMETGAWLGASLLAFFAGLSGSGLFCAVAFRAASEAASRLERLAGRRALLYARFGVPPKAADVFRGGEALTLTPEALKSGDAVIVRPGTVVPADALVVKGESRVARTAPVRGMETREVFPGDRVYAGEFNETGLLAVKADRIGGDTLENRWEAVLTRALGQPGVPERRLRRFCAVAVPALALTGAIGAVLLMIFSKGGVQTALGRMSGMLAAVCPLAMLSFGPCLRARAVYEAARAGGQALPDALWALARADMAVLDQSGIQEGRRAVVGLELAPGADRDSLLRCAAIAYAEGHESLAEAVREYCGDVGCYPDSRETLGGGITARFSGHVLHAGPSVFLRSRGAVGAPETEGEGQSILRIALDGRYLGGLRLGWRLRPGAEAMAASLAGRRLDLALMTPETPEEAAIPAERLGIRDVHAGLDAADRTRVFEELLAENGGRALLVSAAPSDGELLEKGGVGALPGGWAWPERFGLEKSGPDGSDRLVVLRGDSLAALDAVIGQAKIVRRTALFEADAAVFLSLACAALALMTPSALWLIGLSQTLLTLALTALGGAFSLSVHWGKKGQSL